MDDQQLAHALALEGEQWQQERAAAIMAEMCYAIPLSPEEWACYADNEFEDREGI